MKSWAYFSEAYKPNFIKQFVKDLDGIAALDEMGWVFDKKGKFTNPTYLKEKVLETLTSPEGRAALGKLSGIKASILLQNSSLQLASSQQIEQAFIDYFSIDANFIKIFK